MTVVEYVSVSTFKRLLSEGFITKDGTITEKGRLEVGKLCVRQLEESDLLEAAITYLIKDKP